ncbi:RING finger protein [Histoplasma capsulatum var. duboisii H88]|uniref:RBR-type E3 ubiquitin transferase n=1 Tax=Ajellomyces capsulatus (strain H88) TaxID=544711 RepID=F0UV76_AJEC8|nr:RING finger protein [Histoplasma capsulatum var. duboisii H88]QSS50982.1 RING finger domain-containing protein [Histoplasma capsulatum var. duboisii H88]
MDDLCEDERAVELSSIAAIYPEIVIDSGSKFRASLELPVSPRNPLKVIFLRPQPSLPSPPASLSAREDGDALHDDAEEVEPCSLSHLPPLKLEIELPDGYPRLSPPRFSITTNPEWLPPSKVAELVTCGKKLWEECGMDVIIFAYIDHLQQLGERSFDLSTDPELPVILSRDLKVALMDFDMQSRRQKFEQETFECGVCLEPKKGVNCHKILLCSHVFCVSCLQGFYNTCIKEGDVGKVKCLAPNCGRDPENGPQDGPVGHGTPGRLRKKDRTLNPSELLQIPLDQEVVQRYVHFKRKRKLESDKTTIYCPRQWCQGAARSKRHAKPNSINEEMELSDNEDDEDDENSRPAFDPLGTEDQLPPMSERLSVCEDCSYAFCCVCKKGWHGELAFCYPRRAADLSAAEKASEEYIKTYTAPCPTCDTRCQKSMGCNHMICFKCNTHFCYLCSSWLFVSNPYSHFNDPKGSCYMRLWELEEGHDSGPGGPDWDLAAAQMQAEVDSDDDSEDLEQEIAAETGNNGQGANNYNWGRNQRPPPPAPAPPNAARFRAPPPAPVPPGAHANQQNGRRPDDAARAAAAERQLQVQAMAEARALQHNPPDAPPPLRQMAGLQRFLELVQNDQEDEWDSDELDF